jgi:hypothetical protein
VNFLRSRLLALGITLLTSALASAATPTFAPETIYEFPSTQAQPGAYSLGADGRLYSASTYPYVLWSVKLDKASPDFRLNANPTVNLAGTTWVRSRSGLLYHASLPTWGTEERFSNLGWPTTCTDWYTVQDASGTRVDYENFGAITRFGASLTAEKLPVSDAQKFCPTGDMAIDGSDNLYFVSKIDSVTLASNQSAIGTRIYKVAADGSSLTPIHTFAFGEGEGINPLSLLVSQDGQWLYGLSGRRRSTPDEGYLYRVRTDGTGFQKLHAFAQSTGILQFSSSIVELGGYLYLELDWGGAGGQGALLRIRPDGTEPLYFHAFDGTNGSRPSARLVAAGDGNIYGLTGNGGNEEWGTFFRIKPAEIAGANSGVEILHHNSNNFGVGDGLVAAPDGKLYGVASVKVADDSVLTRIYSIDIGYTPPGPVFWSQSISPETAEVGWGSGGAPTATLSWEVRNAQTCSIQGPGLALANAAPSGSQQVTPANEGENVYTLTCDSGSGLPEAIGSTAFVVRATTPPPQPALTFSGPGSAAMGATVTLSWQAANALSCTAGGAWSGSKALDAEGKGSEAVTLPQSDREATLSYTLACTGAGGVATQTVAVKATIPAGEPTELKVDGGGGALAGWPLALLAALALLARPRRTPVPAPLRGAGKADAPT